MTELVLPLRSEAPLDQSDICYPVSPIPFSTGFSTMQLNQDQLDGIIDQFAEIIVDGMDTKTLCQYVYDDLVDYYSGISQHELQEFIENHDEDLWKELVDNETTDTQPIDPSTYTYGLSEGETLSFPVHKKSS